jgi:CRP/FNR family cyclic AMP-dependent transcriptional regulator
MLEHIPLFSNLPPPELAALEKRATTKGYAKNTILVSEGDNTDSLFVIQAGKVKVFLSDEEGKEVILNIHGPGDYFGEIALLDDAPRSASVMTLEDSRMLVISKRDFQECLALHPSIALTLLRDLSLRLRTLTESVRSLALMDVYGRVARTLLSLATPRDGRLVIEQKLTQKDIANMVGASREMVSRILKDLTAGGYVTVHKNGITINEKLPNHW